MMPLGRASSAEILAAFPSHGARLMKVTPLDLQKILAFISDLPSSDAFWIISTGKLDQELLQDLPSRMSTN